ncbi:alpha/beta hydrolase [Corallococcus macrosporus]|uniref:Alpha/beta hydrolase n=1 Tax=Corallococcus macrosporus TaxID=35 RepID=A0ABS3D4F8_9BACT|nr:alpha/beta hydrolase [Corallococcus macrosporus]MBN8226534.1 alpha/beta hydrolase [Corallococcus macrosporus]
MNASRHPLSWSAFSLGLVTGPITCGLFVLAACIGASASGWGYALGGVLLSLGLLTKPWRTRRGLTRVGLALLVTVAAVRLAVADGARVHTERLPSPGTRYLNRLVDERDGTLVAAHALLLARRLPASDAAGFIPALESAFERLAREEGPVATPAIATWLGLQSPEAFDTVVITPEHPSPDTAVVMLHGFAGNFTVYCWQLAQAARAISARTVCPSVGPQGAWWTEDGARTLEQTLTGLKARGIRRVYLAGLSNGAVGAHVLSSRVADSGLELRGLVLISGAERRAATPEVPVLFVQGTRDTMMPASLARDVAARLGRRATWFGVDSGHFAFLDRHAECQEAITTWLLRQEGRASR